jgi:hypothetical protein
LKGKDTMTNNPATGAPGAVQLSSPSVIPASQSDACQASAVPREPPAGAATYAQGVLEVQFSTGEH